MSIVELKFVSDLLHVDAHPPARDEVRGRLHDGLRRHGHDGADGEAQHEHEPVLSAVQCGCRHFQVPDGQKDFPWLHLLRVTYRGEIDSDVKGSV